eukprot:9487274-Pyramimonas_sp.AAC.2
MQDNIYEIEGFGIICCILGVMYPTLTMFDIKAAVPSWIWYWIFSVLEIAGFPGFRIQVLQKLYQDCRAYFRPGGSHGR